MVEVYRDINEILREYKVKSYKVLPGEYVAIKKNGMWHYFNWSYKVNGIVKVRESKYLEKTVVRNARR